MTAPKLSLVMLDVDGALIDNQDGGVGRGAMVGRIAGMGA